jgi:hypothetical protein
VLFTTPYHPQRNIVKRFAGTRNAMIAKFVDKYQSNWDQFLGLFCFAYNTSEHSKLSTTPLSLTLRATPNNVGVHAFKTSKSTTAVCMGGRRHGLLWTQPMKLSKSIIVNAVLTVNNKISSSNRSRLVRSFGSRTVALLLIDSRRNICWDIMVYFES